MQTLHTSIEIHAPPDHVWRILTNFARYPDWNPYFCRAIGRAALGEWVQVFCRTGEAQQTTLRCTVVRLEPERALGWQWHTLSPVIFRGEHTFTLEPLDGDGVQFMQSQAFGGLLAPLLARGGDETRACCESLGQALKARAEAAR